MATCEHGYVLGNKDSNGCPSCQCSQECNTCEAKTPQVMVVQQKQTCTDCDKHQVQLVQTVKEECHECGTGIYNVDACNVLWEKKGIQEIVASQVNVVWWLHSLHTSSKAENTIRSIHE
jgi:hypothetical protein